MKKITLDFIYVFKPIVGVQVMKLKRYRKFRYPQINLAILQFT